MASTAISYGGWVPVKRDSKGKAIWTEKHRWQIAAIPFKFLIILPLKLLTLIFKILLNIVKAFTEFAPMLLRATSDALLHKLWKLGEETLNTKIEGVALIFTVIGLIFSGVVVVLFYLATHALHFFGRALTSPEKVLESVLNSVESTQKIIWVNLFLFCRAYSWDF